MSWFAALMRRGGASAQHPLGGGGRRRVFCAGRSGVKRPPLGCRQHSLMPWVKVGCFRLSLGPGESLLYPL